MALPEAFDGLLEQRVWVAWDDEGGRKVPKSPGGGNAKSNDPSTWGTYAEAEAAASRNGYSGVGIMLTDGLIGIDLDHVVGEDGEIEGWARDLIDEVGSYAELSPSGTGLHILAWADVDEVGAIGSADHAAGIEVYNNRRYFTVTGDALNDEPVHDLTREMPGILSRLLPGKSSEEAVRRAVGSLAADEVKRFANKTMTDNCARDGVRYARVPTGAETCGFCLMLAGRGFVYHSRETAGEMNHYHRSCDCKVVAGFDGLTEVEGYDPGEYLDLYSEARSRLGGNPRAGEISREIERVLGERETDGETGHSNLYTGGPGDVRRESEAIGAGYGSSWDEFRKTGDFESSVNRYLATLSGTGKLSAEAGDKLLPKEVQIGSWFSKAGHDVRFKRPSGEPGDRTADMYIDGELWEVKRVESGKIKKLRRRVSEASSQSENVIADLSVNESITLEAARDALRPMLEDDDISKIMIVASGMAVVLEK